MGVSQNAPIASYTHKWEHLLKLWLKKKKNRLPPPLLNSSETSPNLPEIRQATEVKYYVRLEPKKGACQTTAWGSHLLGAGCNYLLSWF